MTQKINPFADGHLNDESTAHYVDALLEGSIENLPEEVLTHVESCCNCKDKVLELSLFLGNQDTVAEQQTDVSVSSDEPKIIPLETYRRRSVIPMRIAAGFFVAVLMMAAYVFLMDDGAALRNKLFNFGDSTQVQPVDTVKVEPKIQTPAEKNLTLTGVKTKTAKANRGPAPRYRINPTLENMIGSQYRSSGVQIASPQNNASFPGQITFAWTRTGQTPQTLKILDNQNKLKFQYDLTGDSLEFNETLKPGLYYWKLENKQDLLYIGKFFVKR